MKNSDQVPFGPFLRPYAEPIQPSIALFPSTWVTRSRNTPDAATPVDVAPRNDSRQYDQAKVRGAKAALTFIADETRAGEPTVTIESAACADGAARAYACSGSSSLVLSCNCWSVCCWAASMNCRFTTTHGALRRNDSADDGQGDAAQLVPRTVAIDHATLGAVTALCLRQCARLLRLSVTALNRGRDRPEWEDLTVAIAASTTDRDETTLRLRKLLVLARTARR